MDTQRAQVNGVPRNELPKSGWKIEDEMLTSLLTAKDDGRKGLIYNFPDIDASEVDLSNVSKRKERTSSGNGRGETTSVSYHREDSKSDKDDDETSVVEGVKFLGLGDDDSICSSEPSSEKGPQIPDGGWGWVVVIASFFIATVADGLAFSYGLINARLVEYFETSEALTSIIGSLFISVPLILGPLMSALVDRYGCRKMTIVGSIISTIGFILASYTTSIYMLFITYGLIAGLGMGLLYVTCVVSIAYWFEKRRNLAVGLGSCGVGFGTFVFSPLTELLLDEFDWRGTFLLLAGTVINVCVCGAVMRDPEWLIIDQKKQRLINKSKRASSSMSISAKSGGGESVFPGVEEIKTMMRSGETPEYILTALVTSIAEAESLDAATKMNADLSSYHHKVNSVINLPTFLKQSEKVPAEVLDQLAANKGLYNIVLENYPSLLALRSNSEQKLPVEPVEEITKGKPVTMSMKLKLNKKKKKEFDAKLVQVKENLLQPIPERKPLAINAKTKSDWLTRQLSTDHHYLRGMRVHRNSIMHRGAMMNIAKYKLRTSSCPNIYKNSMWSMNEDEEQTFCQRIGAAISSNFDYKMFTEFHFLMMSLSILILFVWFIVPYFYIAPFFKDAGYCERDGTIMLSIFGVATIVGIVGLGWAGDQPWLNVTKTYAVCLIICGISIFLFPIIIRSTDPSAWYSFYICAFNGLIFGLTFSSSYSYTPSILVELIALERFTTTYGLILLCQGMGHLIGPPIAGALKDLTGQWDAAFYVAGIWVLISGLLVGIIPFTKNFRLCGDAPLSKDVAVDPEPGMRIIITH